MRQMASRYALDEKSRDRNRQTLVGRQGAPRGEADEATVPVCSVPVPH